MKKIILVIAMTLLLCFMFSSSKKDTDTTSHSLFKEGVQPYELSISDAELLQSLNLQDKVNIVSFKAPKTTRRLEVNTYVLSKDGIWEVNGRGAVSFDEANFPGHTLEGTFSMLFNDNYSINFNINTFGSASYKTDEIVTDIKIGASSKVFLSQIKEIENNQEIPVAIMIYDSGRSMGSYSTDDYFTPQKFKEMDLVQAVVLTFSDEVN